MPHHLLIFYDVVLLAIIATGLPRIGVAFRTVNTLIHELGHACTSLLLQGSVYRIELHSDASGLAKTGSSGKWSSVVVSLSGYLTSATLAFFLFRWYTQGLHSMILWIFGISAAVALLCWVRNAYGVFWLIAFLVLMGYFIYYGHANNRRIAALSMASIVLWDNLRAVLYITYLSFTQSKTAGDSALLHKTTGIPPFLWSLIFLFISGYLAYKTVLLYFPAWN